MIPKNYIHEGTYYDKHLKCPICHKNAIAIKYFDNDGKEITEADADILEENLRQRYMWAICDTCKFDEEPKYFIPGNEPYHFDLFLELSEIFRA